MARRPRTGNAPAVQRERGNYVCEWFGHRVYPVVSHDPDSDRDQRSETCPFLSAAVGGRHPCHKPAASRGICTISTPGDGGRNEWLVCPFRALEPRLLESAVRRLFGVGPEVVATILPGVRLADVDARQQVSDALAVGGRVFVFFNAKLGGELSIPPTPASPEFSFDITVIEIVSRDGEPHLERFGVIEIQTMDFHGSYRKVVEYLKNGQEMFPHNFAETLQTNQRWLSENVEGPNIANVFKRTFYQMMFKFQLGTNERCAGCVLAIPAAVWASWQRHLGQPQPRPNGDGTFDLFKRGTRRPEHVPAWIYVFDIETEAESTPAPLRDTMIIATDAPSMSHYALELAPAAAIGNIDCPGGMLSLLARRLHSFWPELARTLLD